MKNFLANLLTKLLGSIKRLLRRLRIFIIHKKALLRYLSLGVLSALSIVVIIVIVSDSDVKIDFFKNKSIEQTATVEPAVTISPTNTPDRHIYGDAPLIILDASEFNDDEYISQTALEFGNENDYEGQYYKVTPESFLSEYNKLVQEGNTPNIVIASSDLIKQLGSFQDISALHNEILFNNASKAAVLNDRLPIALEMYGYFFRVDLLHIMSQDVPREYDQLEYIASRLRSDIAYEYLKYDEENEQLAERIDEFITSRYGFGFPGADIGGQLLIEQAIGTQFADGTNILHEIKRMWDDSFLPPDSVYARDENIVEAYMNNGLVGVFSSGKLYERLFKNSDLFYATEVKPYLGKEAVFTANAVYCAVPQGTNSEVAINFLSKLFYGGKLDKIIAQNHTAFLPIGNFLNDGSPWKEALSENSKTIYYNNDNYIETLKYIILGNEEVETALSKSNK